MDDNGGTLGQLAAASYVQNLLLTHGLAKECEGHVGSTMVSLGSHSSPCDSSNMFKTLGNLWPHRAWTEKDDEANVVGRDLKGALRETHDVKPLMNTSLQ